MHADTKSCFIVAPPPRTTLPTTEAVLKVPPTLSMLTELDNSHNLLFFQYLKVLFFGILKNCSSCKVLAYLLMTFDSICSLRDELSRGNHQGG